MLTPLAKLTKRKNIQINNIRNEKDTTESRESLGNILKSYTSVNWKV
jgi:hypothetical protein